MSRDDRHRRVVKERMMNGKEKQSVKIFNVQIRRKRRIRRRGANDRVRGRRVGK